MLKDEIRKLLFFKPSEDSIIYELVRAEERAGDELSSPDAVLSVINKLASYSLNLGIDGNLWQNYITGWLLTDENAYTLSRERQESAEDSFSRLMMNDVSVLRRILEYEFEPFRDTEYDGVIDEILYFDSESCIGRNLGTAGLEITRVLEGLLNAETDDAFKKVLDEQYKSRGTGDFAFYNAFRIENENKDAGLLKPIRATDDVTFADMIGYEIQKGALIRNTVAFLEGRPANNVLLYGDSGSGKSTSVKALLNEYAPSGLRIIEIHKHQFKYISEVLGMIKNRNYQFIIFIDDLSFEEFEIEYKYLKAVIEGDMEARSDNVLIYATSNRRHLIKETWADKDDMTHNGDIHRSDTVEEKTSLSSRFGVSIYFPSPDRMEYHTIVKNLASEAGIKIDEDELFVKADAWEIRHGGVSCRTARQFVDYLASAE